MPTLLTGQIPEQLCPILPGELRNAIRQLVANLHSLLGSLQLKEDIWSIGPYARCVADELEAWTPAKNRRRAAQTSAAGGGGVSLILVDRTLDVAGAAMSGCGGGRESVLGRMLEAHDKLEGHTLGACEISYHIFYSITLYILQCTYDL